MLTETYFLSSGSEALGDIQKAAIWRSINPIVSCFPPSFSAYTVTYMVMVRLSSFHWKQPFVGLCFSSNDTPKCPIQSLWEKRDFGWSLPAFTRIPPSPALSSTYFLTCKKRGDFLKDLSKRLTFDSCIKGSTVTSATHIFTASASSL